MPNVQNIAAGDVVIPRIGRQPGVIGQIEVEAMIGKECEVKYDIQADASLVVYSPDKSDWWCFGYGDVELVRRAAQ